MLAAPGASSASPAPMVGGVGCPTVGAQRAATYPSGVLVPLVGAGHLDRAEVGRPPSPARGRRATSASTPPTDAEARERRVARHGPDEPVEPADARSRTRDRRPRPPPWRRSGSGWAIAHARWRAPRASLPGLPHREQRPERAGAGRTCRPWPAASRAGRRSWDAPCSRSGRRAGTTSESPSAAPRSDSTTMTDDAETPGVADAVAHDGRAERSSRRRWRQRRGRARAG